MYKISIELRSALDVENSQMEKRQEIPLASPRNDLSLSLTVGEYRGRPGDFEIDAMLPGENPYHWFIPMSKETIEGHIHGILKGLEEFSRVRKGDNGFQEKLDDLAGLGEALFLEIFREKEAERVKRILENCFAAIPEKDLPKPQAIEVYSKAEQFLSFPWQLLYQTQKDNMYCRKTMENFWGARFNICTTIANLPTSNKPIQFINKPQLCFLADRSLGSFSKMTSNSPERNEFEVLKNLFIDVNDLKAFNPDDKERELDRLAGFLQEKSHIIHFTCHGEYDSSSPQKQFIRISDEFKIYLYELSSYFQKKHKQFLGDSTFLVFLNACQSGALDPGFGNSFATEFLRQGARSVIATQSTVPDVQAIDFAAELYRNLQEGCSLGISMLKARKKCIEDGQGFALGYTLYGNSRYSFDEHNGRSYSSTA